MTSCIDCDYCVPYGYDYICIKYGYEVYEPEAIIDYGYKLFEQRKWNKFCMY